MDPTSVDMKPKLMLDTIGICLGNKEDFKSEHIKEAIIELLKDENLSLFLMRTVILSAQSHPDLRKFGLSEVVPTLVRGRAWEHAPRVWEGVAMFVKSFAMHRDAESTLRACLGLPGVQLRAIMKLAPASKAFFSKFLKVLSAAEKEEVLTGRWIGLVKEREGNFPSVDEILKNDAEKAKILKELQNFDGK